MFHDKRGHAGHTPATLSDCNRRQSDRHAPTNDQAWIGWWEGRTFRRSPATLVNVSQGGVKLIAESAPARRSTTWICLEGIHRTEWVEGEVLEVLRCSDGAAEVRMVFREICPYTFFEVAVNGVPETPTPRPAASAWATSTH